MMTTTTGLWVVRIRFDGAAKQLNDVDPDASLHAFRERISDVIGVPCADFDILTGFPPRPLQLPSKPSTSCSGGSDGNDDAAIALRDVTGVKNASTLILRRRDSLTAAVGSNAGEKVVASVLEKAASSRDAGLTELSKGVGVAGDGKVQQRYANSTCDREPSLEALSADMVRAVSGEVAAADVHSDLGNLRKYVKDMQLQVQQQRRAMDRQEAALAGAYEIGDVPGQFTLSGIRRNFRVSFKIGRATRAAEDYRVLPPVLLRLMLRNVASHPDHRENLRSYNMALLSPQVFWNLVRIYETGDVESALRQLDPGTDWSFLDHRLRSISERALAAKGLEDEMAAIDREIDKADRKKRRAAKAKKASRASSKDAPTETVARSQNQAKGHQGVTVVEEKGSDMLPQKRPKRGRKKKTNG